MNLRTHRLAATLAATGVTAALVLASPMGADAAKMITGKDIKNGTITSKDVRNGTLQAKDFKGGQLPTAGVAGPAGPAGKPSPQPTTVAVTGTYTTVAGQNQGVLTTTQTIPAYSQVTGLSFESSNALDGCSNPYVYAGVGPADYNNGFAYLSRSNNAGGALQSYFYNVATGPSATPVSFALYCNGNDVPSTTLKVVLAYTSYDPTASSTLNANQAAPSSAPTTLSAAPNTMLAPANR